jgi:hypothetical protein
MDMKRQRRWLIPAGALLLSMSLLATAAFAGTDKPATSSDEDTSVACVIDDWQPTAAEIAEMNTETDALVEYLADAGFTMKTETDEFGITYPVFDEADESNDALWEAMDAFYSDRYGDLDDASFEDWQPSADEIAEINAETDALVAYLADAGFAVEVETDDMGLTNVVFSEADSDNEALWQAVDSFYADYYGDPSEWQPTADELAEINAETDALIAYLADAGFMVEIGTDDLGFTYPAFTEADNDNEALWTAVESFYADRYGEEIGEGDIYHDDWQPTAEQLAQNNAETEGLIAALADAGFTVGTATDELGFVYADFTDADYSNDALMQIVDEYYMALYPSELCVTAELDSLDVDALESGGRDVDAVGVDVVVG